jgi:hypothetical protein
MKVVHKKLGISQVMHAETVTQEGFIHAEAVTDLRRKGDATNKYLYLPVINAPVVGAEPSGDKSATCRPNGLHLLVTAIFLILLKTPVIAGDKAFPVVALGAPSCGSWFDNSMRLQNNWWILGFMSGTESEYRIWEQHLTQKAGPEPLAAIRDGSQVFLWVDKYCKENPLEDLVSAGRLLFLELQEKVTK